VRLCGHEHVFQASGGVSVFALLGYFKRNCFMLKNLPDPRIFLFAFYRNLPSDNSLLFILATT
jgi:hypothetical protein